jgi:hypothetical protein
LLFGSRFKWDRSTITTLEMRGGYVLLELRCAESGTTPSFCEKLANADPRTRFELSNKEPWDARPISTPCLNLYTTNREPAISRTLEMGCIFHAFFRSRPIV